MSTRFSPSNNYDRDLVYDFRSGHEATDDVGDWAVNQHRMEALRMNAQYIREQEEAAQRLRVLQESCNHFAHCEGASCNQGRKPCAEGCNAIPIETMACAEPDDKPQGFWARLMATLGL